MKRGISAAIALGLAAISSGQALAWDGTPTGTITGIDVVPVDGNNFGFRVYLDTGQVMCAGSTAYWAYINSSDNNYQASVAVLNSAFLAGKQVTLYVTTDAQGYCHVGYITMRR